jgi:hypothetical protein
MQLTLHATLLVVAMTLATIGATTMADSIIKLGSTGEAVKKALLLLVIRT